MLQKLLRVLDAVRCRTREAGYFLSDDKIEAPVFGVTDHPKEAIPLFVLVPLMPSSIYPDT